MGTGASELTLTQLATLGKYNNVIFFNDPSDSDLIKTIQGSPRTILINLGQFLNIAAGEIQGDALASDEIEAGQIAAGAVATSELAAGALSADAAGRAKIATNYFDVATVADLFAAATIGDDRMVSSIVKEPGRVAGGRLDFAGAGTAAATVTIGAVTYLEADAEDFPNGVWTNGASGNDSAVSLAAAINGDTRTSPLLYAAVVLTDTVFVFAKLPGTAGNVSMSVSAGEPAAIENLIDGAAAAVKQTVTILHTVTTLEVAVSGTAPEVLIPLPFDASFFSWQVYDSTGGIYATEITARGTVVAAAVNVPAYFRLANNGATDIQAGDIIRLVAQE